MLRRTCPPLPGALAILVVACSTDPSVSPMDVENTAAPLIRAPWLTPTDLVHGSVERPEGGAGVDAQPDARVEFQSRPLQQVINPRTRVGIEPDHAFALGQHHHIGNVASVETAAHVAYRDEHLASTTAARQTYTPFLVDLGQRKHIWANAKVYTDRTCGLSVRGRSDHRAWWQFYQGRGSAEWGVDRKTTQAPPTSQAGCADRTGHREVDEEAAGIVCTYLITFDLDTGEVLNVERLFCSAAGGEVV